MRRISGDVTLPDVPSAVGGSDRPVGLPARYRIQRVIGEGGMGKVFCARDAVLGRDVAIKVIQIGVRGTDGAKQRERFEREARAAARLAHPNIVAVHDVDPDAGWLVMDLVEGESFAEVASRGAAPAGQVRKLAEQVLSALDAAHAAGVIHRDIKPSNILVDASGKVTLVDFGVARLVDAEMTRTGESVGTPAYMAPEQLRGGAIDERTDLYGLGATLYELVTGDRMVAFESPGEAAQKKLYAACPSDPALAAVIGRCLQGEPSARPGSAKQALAELASRPKRRRWIPLAAACVLIAGAVPAWLAMRPGATKDQRLVNAFANAQRGENEKAQVELSDYLVSHPDDAEALTLEVLVFWWQTGQFDDKAPSFESKLEPEQRALVRGIQLMTERKDNLAIAYLETAEKEHPASVEIAFALGEARWHAGYLERGLTTLEHAYELDPRWQMALHHVLEFRLSRREADKLRPIADRMATIDPPRAAALECQMAISDRHYSAAAARAQAALLTGEPIPDLYVCLAQAFVLSGHLPQAENAMRQMRDLWAIDLREWGGLSMESELLLYRGRYTEFEDLMRGKQSRQRDLALTLWDPTFGAQPLTKESPLNPASVGPETFGMRSPPLGVAQVLLAQHLRGLDFKKVFAEDPNLEIRAYGRALLAERANDLDLAMTEYRHALAVPAKGDIRMLAAYGLARLLYTRGDSAGARDACREVIEPAKYYPYRAVLLPDCVLWGDDRAQWQALVDVWKGEFAHPAVVEIRERLAQ